MYCPFCGTDNPDERKFCLACGTPLEIAETKTDEIAPAKKKVSEVHLKIVRETEAEEEVKDSNSAEAEQSAEQGESKHSIERAQKVLAEEEQVVEQTSAHSLYKESLAPMVAEQSSVPEEKAALSKDLSTLQHTQQEPKSTEVSKRGEPMEAKEVFPEQNKKQQESIAQQKVAEVQIKNEDQNFEPEKEISLKRGVILGEEDYFETEPEDKNSLLKSRFRVMLLLALAWIVLVGALSFAYLAFKGSDTKTEVSIPNGQEILTEVSDFKARGEQQALKLSWVPAANAVKITDQILAIYDLDGNLVKQLNIGPEAFAYNLTGLEAGRKYRLALKLEAEDGRESSGSSIFVIFPSDFDQTRKDDLEELKEALATYKSKYGEYPVSSKYAGLLNTLIKEKLIKRRIQDPEYPEHSYEYKTIWDGQGYEIKIYLSNPEDELFGGQVSPNQIYTYTPLDEQTAAEAVLDQAKEPKTENEQEY